MSYSYQTIKGTIEPLPDDILVVGMEFNERVINGIIHLEDNTFADRGIHPRWAIVYKVGSNVDYVNPGQRILVAHGRWTYATNFEDENGESHRLQKIDPKDILVVEEEPI